MQKCLLISSIFCLLITSCRTTDESIVSPSSEAIPEGANKPWTKNRRHPIHRYDRFNYTPQKCMDIEDATRQIQKTIRVNGRECDIEIDRFLVVGIEDLKMRAPFKAEVAGTKPIIRSIYYEDIRGVEMINYQDRVVVFVIDPYGEELHREYFRQHDKAKSYADAVYSFARQWQKL